MSTQDKTSAAGAKSLRGAGGKNRNNYKAKGLVRMSIPWLPDLPGKPKAEAGVAAPTSSVTLTAWGSRYGISTGQVLVILRPVRDWRGYQEELAESGHSPAGLARLADTMATEGTVAIVGAAVPDRPGAFKREFPLRSLFDGESYRIVTVHRSATGVWFRDQAIEADGPVGDGRISACFPFVSKVLTKDPRLLARLQAFTGLDIRADRMVEYRDYQALPLGEFVAVKASRDAEIAASKKFLDDSTAAANEHLAEFSANLGGYTIEGVAFEEAGVEAATETVEAEAEVEEAATETVEAEAEAVEAEAVEATTTA